MQVKNIKLKNERILFINSWDYLKIESIYQDKDVLVFMGNICQFKYPEVIEKIQELRKFMQDKKSYYLLGSNDLSFIKRIYTSHADIYDWFIEQSVGLRFVYLNNSAVIAMHGGVEAKFEGMELCFIKNWHKKYDGRFGYAISVGKTKTYDYCLSLGEGCIQEFNDKGLGNFYQ